MIAAKAEFKRRYAEIDEYLDHLEGLEKLTGISVNLMATMKASALLMMYNLVESTMTNIVQAVFDHLRQKKVGLNSMNDVMKAMVMSNIKKRNPTNLVEKMRAQGLDVAIASFDRTTVFSGNVDSQKMHDTFSEFGIARKGLIKEPVLLEIKKARNDLAHGSKSFADAGKIYTTNDLRNKHVKVRRALERALTTFDVFVNTSAYA